jgi:membrane protein DedA with SNARE-associated domain
MTSLLNHLLTTYGYWAVFLLVTLEGTCLPLPGETMLLLAAIYAGTTHHLLIPVVIVAAASGAILGDNLGFWIGQKGGYRLLRRYGHYIGLKERTVKLGHYLFKQYGEKVVFFGCFVTVLRAWTAFLAGANHMPWHRFVRFNALGSILWAILYGAGGYLLGDTVNRLTGPLEVITVVVWLLMLVVFFLFMRRYEQRLEDEAERALPGSLDDDRAGGRRAEHPVETLTKHGR